MQPANDISHGATLNMASLMAEAERRTGLEDWGEDPAEGNFREPLSVFLKALRDETNLTEHGRARTHCHIANLLDGRLRLIEDRKRNPEIPRQEILEPIFLCGLPRAGTSYLNALVTSDPENLAPYHWQMWQPSPPPNEPEIDHSRQVEKACRLMDFEGWQAPDIRNKHSFDALQVEEDLHMHEFSFVATNFGFLWDVPSYLEYVIAADRTPAYIIEKMMLQTMQLGVKKGRWVLKSPEHVNHLTALFSVFPDASVAISHRDPARVISSVKGLWLAQRQQFGNPPPSREAEEAFLRGVMEGLAIAMEALIGRRQDQAENSRFVDIHFLDLERDPLAQVQKIYDAFDMELKPTAAEAVLEYARTHRKGRFGVYHHKLDEQGITTEEVHDRFAFYFDHFGVERELLNFT